MLTPDLQHSLVNVDAFAVDAELEVGRFWTVEFFPQSLGNSQEVIMLHGHKPPHDRGCGEAGEDVVSVGEVREVRQDDGLAPTLTPHVHLPTLGLGC